MKKNLFCSSVFILILVSSCVKDTPLHHLIHEADVVRVYIYSGNQIAVKYFTNDVEKIKQWDEYIADDTAAVEHCKYEGRLVFKVYEDSTVMHFSLKAPCRVVSYDLKGIAYSKSLTPRGVEYLNTLLKIE